MKKKRNKLENEHQNNFTKKKKWKEKKTSSFVSSKMVNKASKKCCRKRSLRKEYTPHKRGSFGSVVANTTKQEDTLTLDENFHNVYHKWVTNHCTIGQFLFGI